MAFADEMADAAADFQVQLGGPVTLTRVVPDLSGAGYNVATGKRGTTSTVLAGLTAVKGAITQQRSAGPGGSPVVIEDCDYLFAVAAINAAAVAAGVPAFTPDEGDKVTDGGIVRPIVDTTLEAEGSLVRCHTRTTRKLTP